VNLAGKSVDCRYTEANRREILASRVDSARALGAAIRAAARPPRVFVQAGSLAIYGNAGDRVLDDGAAPGEGFSVDVCRAWEAAFAELELPGTRKVMLRIGFALGRDGGALGKLVRLARLGLGGRVGDGLQWISWLHQDDLDRIFIRAIEDATMAGTYNATGPTPVTNDAFMRALRAAVGMPGLPAPAALVRVGAWALGSEAELALHGRRAIPAWLAEQGFAFRHVDLARALDDLVGAAHAAGSPRAAASEPST
jgi:uncharacterized protein (TIGR01777 family)